MTTNFLTTDNATNGALVTSSTSERNVRRVQNSSLRSLKTLTIPTTSEVIARLNARIQSDPKLRKRLQSIQSTEETQETPQTQDFSG